jgi:hypothetical protein
MCEPVNMVRVALMQAIVKRDTTVYEMRFPGQVIT